MTNTISRQAAINACHNWDDGKDSYAFGHVIKERIQKLPSAPRWIPVSESLPEEGKQVLVCDDGGFIYTAEGETRSDGEWQWYESVEYRPMDDVMAWMPLPKPWKGEEGRRRMKDPIERQDAIEAVSKGCQEWRGIFESGEENILALPSVQPDLQEYSVWFRIGETLVDVSKMHITAEEGIEKIRNYLIRMKKPERKTGRWKEDWLASTSGGAYQVWRCSECKSAFNWRMKYCGHCGARMEDVK